MKKFFNFSLSPSKRKYEAKKRELESALQSIEDKKQRLFVSTFEGGDDNGDGNCGDDNGDGSCGDDGGKVRVDDEDPPAVQGSSPLQFTFSTPNDDFRYRQLKSRPRTSESAQSPSPTSIRPHTSAFALNTGDDMGHMPMSLAMTMSTISSTTISEKRHDILMPRASVLETLRRKSPEPVVWTLKEVVLLGDALHETRIGMVEVHLGTSLGETRKLIEQFVSSIPKTFCFWHPVDNVEMETLREGLITTSDLYEGHILIKELAMTKPKDDRIKRLVIKDRQQAAFEQFVQRQQAEPKPAAPSVSVLQLKPAANDLVEQSPPKPKKQELSAPPKPPKHVIYAANSSVEGQDCQIKFIYLPTLERIVIQLKTLADASACANLSLGEGEFRRLVHASEDISLLVFKLNEENTKPILQNLKLVPPNTAMENFMLRLKRFVQVPKMPFHWEKKPAANESQHDVDEGGSDVDVQGNLSKPLNYGPNHKEVSKPDEKHEEKNIETKVRTIVRSSPAKDTQAHASPLQPLEPVVSPKKSEIKLKSSPKRDFQKTKLKQDKQPQSVSVEHENFSHENVKRKAIKGVVVKAFNEKEEKQHDKSETSLQTIPMLDVSLTDDRHRRLRASLEMAARKASQHPTDDDETSKRSPKKLDIGNISGGHVEAAMKKLKAYVHSGAAIHAYHHDVHRDEIEKLYASQSKSISFARHCLVMSFIEFLDESGITLVPHPIEYAVDMDDDKNSMFHQLFLAVKEELDVCDTGWLRDIQHDIRKSVMDEIGTLVNLIDNKTSFTDDEIQTISRMEEKLTLACHISEWYRPTELRCSIFEGTFRMLSKREMMEPYKVAYISPKEKPFLPQFMKNQSALEIEIKDILEMLYILNYSYFNGQRATEKKLRHFTTLQSTQVERVQVMLQAIDERQAKLMELQLAFGDVTSEALLQRLCVLAKSISKAKALTKERSCKLPAFLSNLALNLTGLYSLYQMRLLPALTSHSKIQIAQSLRFLMELVKAHVHDTSPGVSTLGKYIEDTLTPLLALDKLNVERVKFKQDRLRLNGEFCASIIRQAHVLSMDGKFRWKARWDSKSSISSDSVDRYFFKAEHECYCEFVMLIPVIEANRSKDPTTETVLIDCPKWEEVQAHYFEKVSAAWTYLFYLQKKQNNFHVAFGLNIRHTDFLTPETLTSTHLHYFLTHPLVKQIGIGYAQASDVFRVVVRLYGNINPVQREPSSHLHDYEPNAFNELLLHLTETDGQHGYFIAEELTPPEYFVATYCFALRNIIFAVCRQSSLNELWEKQTLNVFLKKLYGFIQQKKTSNTVSVGQEYSLELLWGMLLISKEKEPWFLQMDESSGASPLTVQSGITPTVLDENTFDGVKLKLLVDCANSQDYIVAEYACASLAIFMTNRDTASFFISEFSFSRSLMLIQQARSKSPQKSPQHKSQHQIIHNTGDKSSNKDVYGSQLMYDENYRQNREIRAFVQLIHFVANCIRIVAKCPSLPNEYITTSEKVTKETFVALLTQCHDPPVLVQVLRGLRRLVTLSPTSGFDSYFNRPDFEHLYRMCFDDTLTCSVQSMALKCCRLLIKKYTTNIPLGRMMFDGRDKVIALLHSSSLKMKTQAVYMMLELAMIYILPEQLRQIADSFNTAETKGILIAMLSEFGAWLQDPNRKLQGQMLMDILIRLIIQLDLLSFVQDDFIVDAICKMIQAVTCESSIGIQENHETFHAGMPLRPMLCTSLAKVICKGGNSKWFLKTERLDIIVAVLGQDSTLTEEESAIALYLGNYESQAIKHICHVLGSFYELQMMNTVASEKGSFDVDESVLPEVVKRKRSDDLDPTVSVDILKKFRAIRKKQLVKVFFSKTEELKISRHLHKVYKYYIQLLAMIFQVHNNSMEVFGCSCKAHDGCESCTPSDLLRKGNGGEIFRWLLLAKRIPVTEGAMYNSIPEHEANSIVYNALRVLRFACFNHLFRKEFLEASTSTTNVLSAQCIAMLLKLRDICGDINNQYVVKKKGFLLDAVIVTGQLCAEDGVREQLGLQADIQSHIFSIINDM
ncbi:Aste57867_1333 [Aphanomyces stellatus]|uniref:Aste57867_1333 protein n=1 Tax=Aphanomyces stellatus TaxID=120398 RepID=A0A485K5D4_9STRA|nr:hypothetical protein As57867_001332 [Aphanomyces stellatus]VFT78552.1 Aste57867_1333 [Aphanomyces stellatus]